MEMIILEKYAVLKLKKLFIGALCLTLIASAGLNVYQYAELNTIRMNNSYMVENCISNHEASFANVFQLIDMANIPISKYIKNPDNVSRVIEDFEQAEFYYQEASQFVDTDSYKREGRIIGFSKTPDLILNGYVQELKEYRAYLIANNIKPEYTNEIITNLNDLKIISNWLYEKYKKQDFTVYTDDDFYNDVYNKLNSHVKKGRLFNTP
jgi:hypothetical protein